MLNIMKVVLCNDIQRRRLSCLHPVSEYLLSIVWPGAEGVQTAFLGHQWGHSHSRRISSGRQIYISNVVVGPTAFADSSPKALFQEYLKSTEEDVRERGNYERQVAHDTAG